MWRQPRPRPRQPRQHRPPTAAPSPRTGRPVASWAKGRMGQARASPISPLDRRPVPRRRVCASLPALWQPPTRPRPPQLRVRPLPPSPACPLCQRRPRPPHPRPQQRRPHPLRRAPLPMTRPLLWWAARAGQEGRSPLLAARCGSLPPRGQRPRRRSLRPAQCRACQARRTRVGTRLMRAAHTGGPV